MEICNYQQPIKPFLKFTGSKYDDMKHFRHLFPQIINNYYDPFLGGGAVYLDVCANKYYVNDKDKRIVEFFRRLSFDNLEVIVTYNGLIMDKRKDPNKYLKADSTYRLKSLDWIQKSQITCPIRINNLMKRSVMEEFYYDMRDLYNTKDYSPYVTFFVKEYAYGGLERYNSEGKFNIPYGGNSYTEKNLMSKIQDMATYIVSTRKQNTTYSNFDFEEFLNRDFEDNDFIFLDPPYTTKFTKYANNTFDKDDHVRLRNKLSRLNTKWMIVINKDDFTYNLYKDFNIFEYHKNYKVKIKGRIDSRAKHMVVMNYS